MGNRALTQALDRIRLEVGEVRMFNQIVFAAPDITIDVFEQLVPLIKNKGEQLTLYCCPADHALWASRVFHWNEPRVGERPLHYPGVHTVDVSEAAVGHSYLTSDPDVLDDLRQTLRHGKTPLERELAERPIPNSDLTYYILE